MRVLIDTHTLLWFLSGDLRLTRHAYGVIANPANEVLLSVGSLWEIAIKASIGKLPLPEPFEDLLPAQLAEERIALVPIEMRHLAELRRLPFHHRDPFDRLIVAQARVEGVPVVTRDAAFEGYDIGVIWNASAA